MKRSIFIFSITALLTSNGIFGQTSPERALTNALQKHYQESDLPGFAVSIVTAKGTLYAKGFGYSNKLENIPFTEQTILNLGSVSKAMVGAILIKVIEEKKLDYDSSINDFLPFEISNPYYPEQYILIKHF